VIRAAAFAALSALAATGFSLVRSVAAPPHVPLTRVCSETCAPAATDTSARPGFGIALPSVEQLVAELDREAQRHKEGSP